MVFLIPQILKDRTFQGQWSTPGCGECSWTEAIPSNLLELDTLFEFTSVSRYIILILNANCQLDFVPRVGSTVNLRLDPRVEHPLSWCSISGSSVRILSSKTSLAKHHYQDIQWIVDLYIPFPNQEKERSGFSIYVLTFVFYIGHCFPKSERYNACHPQCFLHNLYVQI